MSTLTLGMIWALVGFASAGDLPKEVVGAWNVSGFYGRSFAAYTIAPDGKVVTEVPRVTGESDMSKQDLKSHWMNGGTVTSVGPGKYVFRNPDFFGQFKGWDQGEAAAKDGVAFHLDSSSSPARIVWDTNGMLKNFFPDNSAMTPDELAKAKAKIEPFRYETEKAPWTVTGTGDCSDPAIAPGKAPRPGSSKIFKALSKPGSTVRFRRSEKELSAEFSSGLSATYTPSALEQSVQINSGQESLTLLDQGEESGKVGTHHFRANVDGKCREIVATNVSATGGKVVDTADGTGTSKDSKPAN